MRQYSSGAKAIAAKTSLALAAVLLTAASCGRQAAPPPESANAPATQPAPPVEIPPSTPAAPSAATPAALTPLTAEGWGPLQVGMTLAEITAALGPDSQPNAVGGADPAACDQFRPARAPEGMLVMVEDGRLSRISLSRNSRVKTDRRLGLGAAPAEVRASYGPALQIGPHKYEDAPAQYLTFWSKGGGPDNGLVPATSRGIRYEVDGSGKVAQIHAGGPSITYVEGCS